MSVDIASSATETHDASILAPASGDPRTSASVRTPMQGIVNRTKWTWKRLQGVIGSFAPIAADAPVAVSAVDTSGETLTVTGHGLSNGDHVRLQGISSATAPGGLAFGTIYFVVGASANTVQLAATTGGSAINITSAGSGVFYLVKATDPDIYLPTGTLVATPGKLSAVLERFAQPLLVSVWTWAGSHIFSGNTLFSALMIKSGNGAILTQRRVTWAQQAGTQTINTNSDIHKFVEPSANCVATVSKTPEPPDGACIKCVFNVNFATFKIDFKTEGGTVLATFPVAGQEGWVEFTYDTDANEWTPTSWGGGVSNIGA